MRGVQCVIISDICRNIAFFHPIVAIKPAIRADTRDKPTPVDVDEQREFPLRVFGRKDVERGAFALGVPQPPPLCYPFVRAGENAKNSERIAMVDAAITQLGNLAESLVSQLKDEDQKKFVSAPKAATFPTTRLTSEAEIDAYVERIRSALKSLLKDADGIDIK